MQITDGRIDKVIHINRLHHHIQPTAQESTPSFNHVWTPPQTIHIELENPSESRRYPTRVRRQPDRFHF